MVWESLPAVVVRVPMIWVRKVLDYLSTSKYLDENGAVLVQCAQIKKDSGLNLCLLCIFAPFFACFDPGTATEDEREKVCDKAEQ